MQEGSVGCPTSLVEKGIDLKADGEYVVAPPSLHVDGRRYQFLLGLDLNDRHLADMPDWLLVSLIRGPGGGLQRLNTKLDPFGWEVIPKDERSDTLAESGM